MWLSGYYNSSVRNTVIDLDEFAGAAKKVKDFCQTNPRATVMSASERRPRYPDAAVNARAAAVRAMVLSDRAGASTAKPGRPQLRVCNRPALAYRSFQGADFSERTQI